LFLLVILILGNVKYQFNTKYSNKSIKADMLKIQHKNFNKDRFYKYKMSFTEW